MKDDMVALSLKILYAQKLMNSSNAYDHLSQINKIILKAKSLFIHLSTAEEGELSYTMKFVKEHPFNEFIPDILNFITADIPSVSLGTFHCL